jgi:hypothetical protein
MRRHQDFRLAILNSTYFNIHGVESPKQVIARYQAPIKMDTFYGHAKRHQYRDRAKRDRELETELNGGVVETPKTHIQGVPVDVMFEGETKPDYVLGLEEFVKLGRDKVNRGEMPVTAANYLQALKIQSDREKSNRDSKVDVFKTMFKGAAPTDGQQQGA